MGTIIVYYLIDQIDPEVKRDINLNQLLFIKAE